MGSTPGHRQEGLPGVGDLFVEPGQWMGGTQVSDMIGGPLPSWLF